MTTWDAIHAERTRLGGVLDTLTHTHWPARSLCTEWDVEQVVAHLSAGASTTTFGWIASMVKAGFNTDKHNARSLKKYLGGNPDETLTIYHRTATSTIAPTKDYAAFLGEVIVHGQDLARPLGIELLPDHAAVLDVAEYFVAKDFAVNSKTLSKDLKLVSDDGSFESGTGPLVKGQLLDLVMAIAGRPEALEALSGPGVAELRQRLV